MSDIELIIGNAMNDCGKIDEALNEKKVVNPRRGSAFKSLPLAIQEVIETGGFEPFKTETALLASVPTLTKKAAYALDTHKIWLWTRTSAEGVTPITGTWTDTGLSAIDQAKTYTDTKKTEAVSAAASDASAKSSLALVEAKADSKTKADNALVDAKTYADSNPNFKSVSLTNTDNLDTIVVSGTYTALTSTIASLDRNYPVAEPGVLEVTKFGTNNTVVQKYITTSGKQYTRRLIVSWGTWIALATELNLTEVVTSSLSNKGVVSGSSISLLVDVGLYSVSNMTDFPSDFPATYGILKRFRFGSYAYWELSTTNRPDIVWQKVGVAAWKKISVEDSLAEIVAKDALSLNRDKLYPMLAFLRASATVNSTPQALEKHILDVKVNNANADCYYRISYFGNNSTLASEANKFGWALQEITKTGYTETGGTVRALTNQATTKFEIPVNVGIIQFTLKSTVDAAISFDFTVDTTGFDQSVLFSHAISTSQAWGHVIDPLKYSIKQAVDETVIDVKIQEATNKITAVPSLPTLTAASAGLVVIDQSGIADFSNLLFSKSISASIAPASVTKVMSVIIALESGMSLNSLLTTSTADIIVGSGNNLLDGDQITLLDALFNMMLPSSNTTANLVARGVGEFLGGDTATFISRMNSKAADLAMTATTFKNPSGLAAAGHVSSVNDLLKLGVYASSNATMKSIWGVKQHTLNVLGSNPRQVIIDSSVDPVINNDPWVIGGKTGTLTPNVYNILLSVRLPNGFTGVAVTVASSSDIARYDDIKNMVEYVRDAYAYPAPSQIILKN